MSWREAKEHTLSFLSRLSGVAILANGPQQPMSQSRSGGFRRGTTVAILLAQGLLFFGLHRADDHSARSNLPKSTIGKTGEMKSPGGSAYNSERLD
jgi:hypothetical protein